MPRTSDKAQFIDIDIRAEPHQTATFLDAAGGAPVLAGSFSTAAALAFAGSSSMISASSAKSDFSKAACLDAGKPLSHASAGVRRSSAFRTRDSSLSSARSSASVSSALCAELTSCSDSITVMPEKQMWMIE